MNTQALIELAEKISNGSATTEDIVLYNSWYNSFKVEDKWNEQELGPVTEKENYLLNNIYAKIRNRRTVRLWPRMLAGVAAALIVISLYVLFNYNAAPKPYTFEQITGKKFETPYNMRKTIVLTDGTEAVLYPGSKLVVANDFNDTDRKISITGQVYLKIFHDKAKPFIAYSKHTATTAIGTAFYVRDFERAQKSAVMLIEGKVSVQQPDHKQVQYLEPGTAIEVDQKTLSAHKKIIDKDELLALAEQKLYFDHADMSDVVRKLELFYGIEIDLTSCNCKFKRINGNYSDHSLVSILNTISYINNISWKLTNQKVVFTPKTK